MTVVVGHRTMPRHAPENSLEGIRVAAELGAEFVEVDVRLSRDGVPVLHHDSIMWRTVKGLPWPVAWSTATSLTRRRLRGSGEHIPTLAAGLAALPPELGMAIDTKDPDAAPAVLEAVRAARCEDRVLLWSQFEPAVRHYATNAPDNEVALLRDTPAGRTTTRLLDDAVAFGASAVSIHQSVATAEVVAEAHERGLAVYSWFQSFASQRDRLSGELDGVVTDWVVEARQRLTEG